MPEKSGFPSGSRGVGAVKSGLPSAFLGTSAVGWRTHWPRATAGTPMAAASTSPNTARLRRNQTPRRVPAPVFTSDTNAPALGEKNEIRRVRVRVRRISPPGLPDRLEAFLKRVVHATQRHEYYSDSPVIRACGAEHARVSA